jgi:hypothetical protein
MHDGAAQSRDVETLGRRGDGDGARRDLRMQRREWDMRVARIDDIRVDLVGQHHQIIPDREVRNLSQFCPGEGAPGGVLRMAEYQHAQARMKGCLIGTKIEHPPRAVIAHRAGNQAAARILDGAHEGRVGGKLQQDCVTRFAERHNGGEAGLHQIADCDRVCGIGVPAEAPLHAADEGRGQHAVARG